MIYHNLNGRLVHKAYVVPIWQIIALVTLWHTATYMVGQVLDMLPPCLYEQCDDVTRMVLVLYRFLAGN